MPFVNRFASPFAPPPARFGILRHHPVVIASGAATAGVLLGAFVAVQVLATPEKLDANAAQTKPAPPIAETTGSAPSAEPSRDAATTDCDKQTWPYLSRDCMKNGGARVVTTDKRDQSTVGAIEAPKSSDAAKPAPAPSAPGTSALTAGNPPPAAPTPAATTAAATTEPVAKPDPVAQAAAEPKRDAAKAEPKPKAKYARKQKRRPARQEFNDNDNAFANDDSDNRFYRFYDRRYDRRRVVQRGNESDRIYGRRDFDDDGQRRVIVIRRGGGGLFGSLFGGRFGDDD